MDLNQQSILTRFSVAFQDMVDQFKQDRLPPVDCADHLKNQTTEDLEDGLLGVDHLHRDHTGAQVERTNEHFIYSYEMEMEKRPSLSRDDSTFLAQTGKLKKPIAR